MQHCLPKKIELNRQHAERASLLQDIWVILQTLCPYWLGLLGLYAFTLSGCLFLAYLFRFDFDLPRWDFFDFWHVLPWMITPQLLLLFWFGQLRGMLSYFSFRELRQTVAALGLAFVVQLTLWRFIPASFLPARSILPLDLVLSLGGVCGVRLCFRMLRERATLPRPSKGSRQSRTAIVMDRAVAPGDNFFAFGNGGWIQRTEIPADRAGWGSFAILAEEADRRTAELIRQAGSAPQNAADARRIGDYYAAYMNEAAIEAKGLAPLQPELAAIAALADRTALASYLGALLRADVDPLNATDFYTDRLFGLWVSPDLDQPERNLAYLLQGGLGMPDRDNYLANTDERSVALQAKYREHAAAVLALAGYLGALLRGRDRRGDRAL